MRHHAAPLRLPLHLLVPLLGAFACSAPQPSESGAPALPWPAREESWRTDRTWHDGLAEVAVYDATRTIYGLERRFTATVYTNKQRMSSATTVKANDGDRECFKQHTSERVPTEKYDYDFSLATFSDADDLDLFKLTVSTQDDCGASFKHLLPDRRRGGYRWWESVYLPDAGVAEDHLGGPFVAYDALPLVLRDFPFGEGREFRLRVVPGQKHTRSVPFTPRAMVVRDAGTEELELPLGRRRAHALELVDDGRVLARFWFDAEARAPWLHVLLAHEGPEGVDYRLRTLERTAYWAR